MTLPARPSDDKVAAHMRTHIPFEPWCRSCVLGRARDEAHRRQKEKESVCTPTLAMDYGFLSLAEIDGETISGMMASSVARDTGLVTLNDCEHLNTALADAVRTRVPGNSGV